jgi:HD-GYP domain-containing protein (c-di-GMP phosphodiesterase class II)
LAETDWSFVREDGTPLLDGDNPVSTTLNTGEGSSDLMIGMDAPGLARRWITVSTTPLISEMQTIGQVVIFDEVTARKRGEQRLRLLLEVSRLLTSVVDEEDFLQCVCNALVDVGGYAMSRILAVSSNGQHPVKTIFSADFGGLFGDAAISWLEFDALGQSLCGVALRTGITQIVNDLTVSPAFAPWRALPADAGLSSAVAIPFGLGQRSVALGIYDRYTNAFDGTIVDGLEEIARECEFGAGFIRSVQQLATALTGTISALGHMTETRDPYTSGHQTRVGSLGERIAIHLGLDAKLAALIGQSGALHDVGKIAVPSEILTRPGRLTDLEFQKIKSHPVVGNDILTRASLPWPIAEVALQHHERLDGSGYPKALQGEEIILPARIIAVADVVEAMTQHRPYRPGLGLEIALAEVENGAGIRFDADVAAACVAVFDAGFTFERISESARFG